MALIVGQNSIHCSLRVFGQVVRGPAPLSLALAKRGEADGKVVLSAWTETDFRDGEDIFFVYSVFRSYRLGLCLNCSD